MNYPANMFYELFLRDTKYHFVFYKDQDEVARIELDVTPHQEHATQIVVSDDARMTDSERLGLHVLAGHIDRCNAHAFVMTREYLQGHSGKLDVHPKYGQMLFGMDLEDFDHI